MAAFQNGTGGSMGGISKQRQMGNFHTIGAQAADTQHVESPVDTTGPTGQHHNGWQTPIISYIAGPRTHITEDAYGTSYSGWE